MTRQALAVTILLLTWFSLPGCTTTRNTSSRTLGAIEASPQSYDGEFVSFRGTARDVEIGDRGTQVLVSTGLDERNWFRVEYPLKVDLVRGDRVSVMGRVRSTSGVVGLGDRLTRTVQIDAVYLVGPNGGSSLSSSRALVDRWEAGEAVVLP